MAWGDRYIEVDGVPVVEPDKNKWAEWYERTNILVARDVLNELDVRTWFLGLNYSREGTPLLYETMVFGDLSATDVWEGWEGWGEKRYSTREQAFAGHQYVVARIKEGLSPE